MTSFLSEEWNLVEQALDVVLDLGERIRQAEKSGGRGVLLLLALVLLVDVVVLQVLVKLRRGRRLFLCGRRRRFLSVLSGLRVDLDRINRFYDILSPGDVTGQGHVKEGRVLLDDGKLNVAGLVTLGKDLHGVDAGQEDSPELAFLRCLESDVASFHLNGRNEKKINIRN